MNKILAAVVVLGGLVNGGYNLVQAKNDAKASIPDMAWGVTQGAGSWWGGGALLGIARFVWANRKGPVAATVLHPDPKNPPPEVGGEQDTSNPKSATVMELHNADIDIRCVLRGESETDAEGLKRIGAVLDYYASRKGGAK